MRYIVSFLRVYYCFFFQEISEDEMEIISNGVNQISIFRINSFTWTDLPDSTVYSAFFQYSISELLRYTCTVTWKSAIQPSRSASHLVMSPRVDDVAPPSATILLITFIECLRVPSTFSDTCKPATLCASDFALVFVPSVHFNFDFSFQISSSRLFVSFRNSFLNDIK